MGADGLTALRAYIGPDTRAASAKSPAIAVVFTCERRSSWFASARRPRGKCSLLMRDITSGREVLRTPLAGPHRFSAVVEERRLGYALEGAFALDRLVSGVVECQPSWRPRRDAHLLYMPSCLAPA